MMKGLILSLHGEEGIIEQEEEEVEEAPETDMVVAQVQGTWLETSMDPMVQAKIKDSEAPEMRETDINLNQGATMTST